MITWFIRFIAICTLMIAMWEADIAWYGWAALFFMFFSAYKDGEVI